MKKNKNGKENSNKKKQVMVIHSDNKNWSESDFYPMQHWSLEDRQLWEKIMLEKKKRFAISDSLMLHFLAQ